MTRLRAAPNRLFGIDVSSYQDDVDWNGVKKAGVLFAFIKASEGITLADEKYARNAQLARQVGIPFGPYHFFRPNDDVDAQVNNFCTAVGALQVGDLPPVLDVEIEKIWKPYTLAQRIDMIVRWMTAVEKRLGVKPILYLSTNFAGEILGSSSMLKDYVLWVADYIKGDEPNVPLPWTAWVFWQYFDKATVGGVTGDCDVNWFNGTADDLAKLLKPATSVREYLGWRFNRLFNRLFGWLRWLFA